MNKNRAEPRHILCIIVTLPLCDIIHLTVANISIFNTVHIKKKATTQKALH